MRRTVWPVLVAAVTVGDVFWFGVFAALAIAAVLTVAAVGYQWHLSKQVSSYRPPLPEDPEAYELDGLPILPGDAAASDVYVGLLLDDRPTGPRKRAKVLLDGSVRFVKPVFLPIPPDGYDEVGVWAEDESFRTAPLVRLSPWLCATETADGNVAIANLTA